MSAPALLRGNVAAKPRFFPEAEGKQAMASFPVASNRRSNGTDYFDGYFDVTVFGQLAKNVVTALDKGSRVIVEGAWRQTKRSDGSYHTGVVGFAVGNSLEFIHRSGGSVEPDDEALQAAISDPQPRDESGRFVSAS